jgi:hypothetical protein
MSSVSDSFVAAQTKVTEGNVENVTEKRIERSAILEAEHPIFHNAS